MTRILLLPLLAFGCGQTPPPAAAPPVSAVVAAAPSPPPAPKADSEKTVADVAAGSPDHTTLVAALTEADLVTALSSPGGVYTVFAPTNAAFAALPAGTVEGLMKPEHKADLRKILMHHAGVPTLTRDQIADGDTLVMSDGTKVTFHVTGDTLLVDDAKVLATIPARNGIVYVVDKVLLPPAS